MSSFIVTNIARKNNYLGFFKFYQPKATGGGYLIFEWTLLLIFFTATNNTNGTNY
jgi:hypothetical protein